MKFSPLFYPKNKYFCGQNARTIEKMPAQKMPNKIIIAVHPRFYLKNEYFCGRNTVIFYNMDRNYKVRDWILDLPKRGKITFSMDDIHSHFQAMNKNTITSALRRLVEKGKIQSVWHGFYVVIPVEYELRGVVPPILYIDLLMKYLKRDYYIALLNAAVFYGAAHQQPQEFTIITDKGNFRDKLKNGVKINFITKKSISHSFTRKMTTKTGYVEVSSPELTAMDLILYQKEIGGLSRASTVLNELAEEMDFGNTQPDFIEYFPTTTIQRLGYILDEVLEYGELAKTLFEKAKQAGIKFRNTLLKPGIKTDDISLYEQNETWKIIINETIEIDE
jgi:predicted transcriptional regulator of viral defense system